jgi:hypothetical protein
LKLSRKPPTRRIVLLKKTRLSLLLRMPRKISRQTRTKLRRRRRKKSSRKLPRRL